MDNRTIKISGCLVLLLSVFCLSAATVAYASYQKIAPGGTVTLGEFVFDDDFVATTTPCTIGITTPLNVEIVPSTTPMTANNDGWHYYAYTTAVNAVSGTWPSVMKCGSTANGDLVIVDKSFIVDWSVVSTSTIKVVVDESLTVATSSLAAVINANTNTAVLTASSSLFATLPATIWSFSGRTLTSFGTLVADIATAVWSASTRSLTTFGTLVADVWTNTTRTLTGAGLDSGSLATLSDVQTATSSLASAITAGTGAVNSNTNAQILIASSSLATEIAKRRTVTLSDFGETTVNTAYKAKLQVLNHATVPTDADSLPTVTIIDPAGTTQVSGAAMTKDSNGTYNYSYSIPGNAVGGVWETVVLAVINGQTVRVNDYWSLSSSPADVNITEIIDRTIPTIKANVRIDNMGTSASDFYYVYCIVTSEDNLCGGNDDVDYGSDTSYINAGGFINLLLVLDEVSPVGTYWFKVKARALAETNWAASSEQFTALAPTVSPPIPRLLRGNGELFFYWAPATTTSSNDVFKNYDFGWASGHGGPYSFISLGSTTQATFSGLTNGTTYYFVLRVKSESGTVFATSTEFFASPTADRRGTKIKEFSPAVATTSAVTHENGTRHELSMPQNLLASGEHLFVSQQGVPESAAGVGKPLPSGKLAANTWLEAGFRKYSDMSEVSTLDQPVTMSFYYTDEDISGIDESTLVAYRWDGSEWQVLSGSTVDTVENKITFSSTHFSTFTVMGTAPATPSSSSGSSGGGGGGGGGGGLAAAVIPTLPSAGSCSGADFNADNKVNSVDFSILLAFWQKQPPFKNPCVDINKDNKVNSVDFSILLYQWKK